MRLFARRIAFATCAIAAGFLFALGMQSPARADKRVALVIGNSDYPHVGKLANTLVDSRAMRDALHKLEFTVIYGENLDRTKMDRHIGDFAAAVRDADVAIVYFAGHGATFGEIPYVVPTDAEYKVLERVPYELVPVERLIGELRRAKGVRIAILDACRDNERETELKRETARKRGESTRGGALTRGLAKVTNADGLIVAYAAQYLTTAGDGLPGRNSPFTGALVKHMEVPDLDVKVMFFKVAQEVIKETKGEQRPEISVSMFDDYVLRQGKREAAPAVLPPAPAPSPPTAESLQAWQVIKDTNNCSVLDAFIRRFGDSFFSELARERIKELNRCQVAAAAPLPATAERPAQLKEAPANSPAKMPTADEAKKAAPASASEQKSAAALSPTRPNIPPAVQPATGVFPSKSVAIPLTETDERVLRPKNTFKECDTCPEMIVVASGTFKMGSLANEAGRASNESPQHDVTISRPFAVGRFIVTFDEWDACVTDGGCDNYRPSDQGWGRGRMPLINISWNNAKAYVAWLARKTGKPYRLLSEAEAEYIARAGSSTPFWWGPSIATSQANYDGREIYGAGSKGENRQRTMPVDSFSANPWGLYQVHGNVWTWVEDCWNESYKGAPSDGSAWQSGMCNRRVLRGGGWNNHPKFLRAAYRNGHNIAEFIGSNVGLRVARSLAP